MNVPEREILSKMINGAEDFDLASSNYQTATAFLAKPENQESLNQLIKDGSVISPIGNILNDYYKTAVAIPNKYRNASALEKIYSICASSNCDIGTAIKKYEYDNQMAKEIGELKEKSERERKKREAEEREAEERETKEREARLFAQQQAAMQNSYYERESESSGGGLFDSIAAGIIGGAVAGSIAKGKQGGRQNYMGTAGCAISQGKCGCCVPMDCGLMWHCTQNGRYKVGS
jgi:hypothetical protein